MKLALVAVVPIVFAAAGCSSMQNGVFAVEGTGVVYDNYEAKDPVPGSTFRDSEVDVKGFGIKGAFNTPVIDIIGTIERREFEDENALEVSAGVRKRIIDVGPIEPYVELRLLRGGGLKTSSGHDETYGGLAVGAGVLFAIGDHLFFDANVSYEATSDIDVGPDKTPLRGTLGRIGIGWSF